MSSCHHRLSHFPLNYISMKLFTQEDDNLTTYLLMAQQIKPCSLTQDVLYENVYVSRVKIE